MGFYNIYLEGEQADRYKMKKHNKEVVANASEKRRYEERYGIDKETGKHTGRSGYGSKPDSASEVHSKALLGAKNNNVEQRGSNTVRISSDEDQKRAINTAKVMRRAGSTNMDDADAINRHMRRHPEQWENGKYIGPKSECGIFGSVEFI